MNDKQLNAIFRNYIEKFDQITYEPHLENYKWEIAYETLFYHPLTKKCPAG